MPFSLTLTECYKPIIFIVSTYSKYGQTDPGMKIELNILPTNRALRSPKSTFVAVPISVAPKPVVGPLFPTTSYFQLH